MTRITLLAACLALLPTFLWSGLTHAADRTYVEFEGRYWLPSLTATARMNAGSLRGNDINLERDLDLGNEDFPGGRFTWYITRYNRIYFDYTQATFNGGVSLAREITFAGTTFQLGSGVETDLDFKFGRLGWIWQFIHFADDRVKFGTVLDIKVAQAEIDIRGRLNNLLTEADKSITGPLPSAGLALDVIPFDWLQIFAQGSGIPATSFGYYISAEGGVKLIPYRFFSISAGYRYETIKVKDDDDFIKLKFDGPFVGASLRF